MMVLHVYNHVGRVLRVAQVVVRVLYRVVRHLLMHCHALDAADSSSPAAATSAPSTWPPSLRVLLLQGLHL